MWGGVLLNENDIYSQSAREYIKKVMCCAGLSFSDLYELLYGETGTPNQVQTLRNRLNRGGTSSSFIGLCVEKIPELREVSLSDFFNVGEKQNFAGEKLGGEE